MIARLKGLVDLTGEDWVILDVGGVGYHIYASARTLSALPGLGEAVRLEIETHVREDHIHLYGFTNLAERDWFRLLTSVQGVGAKVCLAILSALSPDQLIQAIASADKTMIARANGVGPKLAARIATELKDKVGGMSLGGTAHAETEEVPKKSAKKSKSKQDETDASEAQNQNALNYADDAVSALVNLGFARADAHGTVARLIHSGTDLNTLSDLIRLALKELNGL